MSAAVDANVLLYASDDSSPRQAKAEEFLRRLAAGPELVYLFWPVVMAYLRVASHPGIFDRPLSPESARLNVDALLRQPHVRAPGEASGFWNVFRTTATQIQVRGNLVSDTHIVALMRQQGVSLIWTADRDFRRFDGIESRDPLV